MSPVFGEIYTVINKIVDDEGDWYELGECKDGLFKQVAFIPLSNIDEMELVENCELVNQL